MDNFEKTITSILVGNNIVNIALSAIITSIALELFGSAGVGYATVIVTILLLIFGEITPKTIGTRHPEGVAFLFAPLIKFFGWIFTPVVFILTKVTRLIASVFGVKFSEKKVSFTEEEIKQFIKLAEIEKQFGKGAVMKMGENTHLNILEILARQKVVAGQN